jgi:hypothetical protein
MGEPITKSDLRPEEPHALHFCACIPISACYSGKVRRSRACSLKWGRAVSRRNSKRIAIMLICVFLGAPARRAVALAEEEGLATAAAHFRGLSVVPGRERRLSGAKADSMILSCHDSVSCAAGL